MDPPETRYVRGGAANIHYLHADDRRSPAERGGSGP